jgi:hypothetical protein
MGVRFGMRFGLGTPGGWALPRRALVGWVPAGRAVAGVTSGVVDAIGAVFFPLLKVFFERLGLALGGFRATARRFGLAFGLFKPPSCFVRFPLLQERILLQAAL